MALRHAPFLLALAATASWAATPATIAQAGAKCLIQTSPTAECYQLLRAAAGADRVTIRRLQAQVNRLQKERSRLQPTRRPRKDIEEANRVFNSEFSDLRNTPGAFALASDLVVERMKDPRYSEVPLDMIVRDVASRVQRVAGAGNEKLAAEAQAAERDAADTRAEANQKLNACYDRAERVIDAAQAIIRGSESDADTAAALAIINAATPGPATPAPSPSAHCTSRTVRQGQYARTETDCN